MAKLDKIVSSLSPDEELEKFEEGVVRRSEFKEAISALQIDIVKLDHKLETSINNLDHKLETSINNLDHKLEMSIGKLEAGIEIVKSEIGHLKWSIPLYFGIAIAILKYFN